MKWRLGEVHDHWGWKITATLLELREPVRIWRTIDPVPIGMCYHQSFFTFEEVCRYIESRETEKVLYVLRK